jgi:hypothetical protein
MLATSPVTLASPESCGFTGQSLTGFLNLSIATVYPNFLVPVEPFRPSQVILKSKVPCQSSVKQYYAEVSYLPKMAWWGPSSPPA